MIESFEGACTLYQEECYLHLEELQIALNKFGLQIVKSENNRYNHGLKPDVCLLHAIDHAFNNQ